ncbi:hypothetical protein PRIPAC_91980 [Pristionchus pacificus]|uniref:acid phosphatase n=1 Tax=Pristionchus pacificus TaxID=54126 RepID=A0A2A6CDF3_PRIPA|nr:hypothetical protein PRIPAC_91980 [Pristionchus pacificus]|eukprot:PDM76275.1 Phosphatase [Pristionchus pacificus]
MCCIYEKYITDMRSLHLAFLVASLVAAKHHNDNGEDKLLSVQVVIRHADRAATTGWATDKSERILFRGNGELTDLLVPLLTCNDGWEDVVAKYDLKTSENAKDTALVKMLSTQWDAPECSQVPPALVDAIIAELVQKEIKMPDHFKACAKGHAKKFMFRYIEMLAGAGDHFNALRLKRVAGMLTNELLSNMQKAASCSPPCNTQPKFRVYYTHDVTVLAVAHIFKALHHYEGVTPAFSSAVVFETRMNATGPYVKVFLKNGHKPDFLDTGLCYGNCTLEAVVNVILF